MNKITTLALLLVLFVSTASASVWINEESVSVTPNDPQVGEEVTVSFYAGTNDLRVEEMGVRFPGEDWQMRDCDLTACGQEEVGTWSYTPSSTGQKEIEFKATSSNFLASEATHSETINVQSGSSGASVTWENNPPLIGSGEKAQFGEEYDFSIHGESNSVNIVGLEIRRYNWGGPSQGYVLADTYTQSCRTSWVLPVSSCDFTQPITLDSSDNTLQRFTAEVDLQFTDQDPTNTITVEYEDPGPFYSNFSYSPQNPEAGETITFNAACDSPSDTLCARGQNIDSYEWDLDGDENYDDATTFSTSTTLDSNTEVGLKITSSSGQTSTKRKTVNVEEGPFYANYSYSPQNPNPGETVTFDASCSSSSDTTCARGSNIESYEWDFGDDGSYESMGFSTTRSFDSDTEVTLKITNVDGQTRDKTKTVNVGEVTAGFSYSPQNPDTGETVTFDASCSSSNDETCSRGAEIDSYEWDFDNDGSYDDGSTFSATHSFQSDTEVGLRITTASGATRTASRTVNVNDGQDASCEEFTDSDLETSLPEFESVPVEGNSYDGEAAITNNGDQSLSGNFGIYIKESNEVMNCDYYNDHYSDLIGFVGGDVSPSPGSSDSFSFSYSGNPIDDLQYGETYTLVGVFNSESTVYVGTVGAIGWQRSDDDGDNSPNAGFTYETPVNPGESVVFDASSSTDPDGDLESYEWDFDDDGDYDDGSTFSVSHTFDSTGTYDVGLKVTDARGNTDTVEQEVDVISENDNEPVAGFTWDDHPAIVGDSVTFDASSTTDEDGDVENYEWDFDGDGDYDDGSSFSAAHTFNSPGTYDVGLKVTDSNDNTDTVEHDVEVVEAPGQCAISVGTLTLEDTVIDYGESTQASIQVHNNGDAQDFTVKFKIDGDTVETRSREISEDSSSTFSAPVSPTQDGYINVEVNTEGDPCGDSSYARYRSITVVPGGDDGDDGDDGGDENPVSPEVSFSWSPSQPGPDSTVTFDASSTTDPQDDIDQYKWFFGDGSAPEYGETVEHSYTSTGDYDVQLVVNDTEGNSDSRTRRVPVRYDAEACSVQVSSLNIGESYIDYGDSTSASVTVSNLGERQEFIVKFKVSGEVVENREVVIDSNSQRTLSKMISPTKDSYVTAEVTTNTPPCEYEQWTRYKQVLVIPGGDGGDQESTLDVNVQNSDGRRLSNARISVERPSGENLVRYTGSSGTASFGLSEGSFDVATSKSGYRSDFRSVSLDSGEHETVTITLDRREEDIGTLIALVEDGGGDRLQNAEITVTDTDEVRSTDSNGRTSIDLESGTYSVRAEKQGYGEITKTVEIDEGEDTTEVFRLGDKDLEITGVSYPSSVCRGSSMKAEVTIENSGELHRFVSLTGSGLGSINAVSSFGLDSGSSVTKKLRFTNVQGSGNEQFTITASNQDSDQVTRTVQVDSCPTPVTQKPSDISLTVGYTRTPQMAVAGDIIKVDGFVDGVNGRSTVDILVDDEVKATVNTNPGGFYSTWITAQDVGPHTIKAKAGEATDTKPLRIIPTSQVTAIDAPVSVFESQEYQICAQVNSQIEPEVALVRDGNIVTSKKANGEVCFDREARDPGTHKYEIASLTSGEGNTASTTVEVLEMDVEASSFPNQIASVESGSGMVKVELYNNNDDQKQYDLKLEGLPSTWMAQSEKSVILEKGERETVYFYLTPQEEGSYRPTIRVTSGGSGVYEEELDLITGGTTDSQPRKDGFFSGIFEGLSKLFAF